MMLDFELSTACSIKSLAVARNNEVKPKTRFFNYKMLMFSKLSLISFIYDAIESFYFPNEIMKKKL